MAIWWKWAGEPNRVAANQSFDIPDPACYPLRMAVALQSPPRTEPRALLKLEPLENGDCLTAREFLRRFEAMPHVKKAKLSKGIVSLGSPVRLVHVECHTLVQG